MSGLIGTVAQMLEGEFRLAKLAAFLAVRAAFQEAADPVIVPALPGRLDG